MSDEQKPAQPTAQATTIKKRRLTVEEKRAELERKRKEIDARLSKLEAKTREQQRKDETRAKIVIGGIFLAAIADGDEMRRKWLSGFIKDVPERDQQLIKDAIQRAVDRRPPPSPTAQTQPTKGTGG